MERSIVDKLISFTSLFVAVILIVLGFVAIYGGHFGTQNVRDRLEPEKVFFPPLSEMSEEEKAAVGEFAGQQVVNGNQAEGFARFIGGHLEFINDGKTYAETSAAARVEGLDPEVAAELQGKADTLFKGETLRAIMLNTYGWWTVSTIVLWTGRALVLVGILLLVLALLGFRHAKKA